MNEELKAPEDLAVCDVHICGAVGPDGHFHWPCYGFQVEPSSQATAEWYQVG